MKPFLSVAKMQQKEKTMKTQKKSIEDEKAIGFICHLAYAVRNDREHMNLHPANRELSQTVTKLVNLINENFLGILVHE